jgi:uncharacterized membrane protein
MSEPIFKLDDGHNRQDSLDNFSYFVLGFICLSQRMKLHLQALTDSMRQREAEKAKISQSHSSVSARQKRGIQVGPILR